MSEVKPKETLMRLAWIAALRREGHRKCTGEYQSGFGKVCALGLLAEVAGKKVDGLTRIDEVGGWAGLDFMASARVMNMNDGVGQPKRTFSEIAGWLEGGAP